MINIEQQLSKHLNSEILNNVLKIVTTNFYFNFLNTKLFYQFLNKKMFHQTGHFIIKLYTLTSLHMKKLLIKSI